MGGIYSKHGTHEIHTEFLSGNLKRKYHFLDLAVHDRLNLQ